MERRKHHVTGFGGFECDFNCFLVAHLADQNYFGRLTKGGTQSESKTGRVAVQFALVNRGAFVRMEEFDRVLDRDDVVSLLFVDLVQNRGEA